MKKIEEEIRDVVEIVEQVYSNQATELARKLDNFKRINVDTVAAYIKEEQVKGNFQNRDDIIKYIQSIVQD